MSDSEKQKQWAKVLEKALLDSAQARVDLLRSGAERHDIAQKQADKTNDSSARIERNAEEASQRAAIGDPDFYLMMFSEIKSTPLEIGEFVRRDKNRRNATHPREGARKPRDEVLDRGRSLAERHQPHEITRIIYERLGTPSKPTIRKWLKEAGIIPDKKNES